MNKKTIKIISMISIILLIVMISTNIFAALTPGQLQGTPPATNDVQNFGNKVIGILQTVGIVLSVVILIVIGIKYMMGSAEEKAEYKKTMMPYIIGAALIFAASVMANIIYNFFTNMG